MLDLNSEVAAWVNSQLQVLGSLAEHPDETTHDVARALGDLGCNLFQQLLPLALQDLYWTFRQRGVKTMMILSDEPHIPWELIKPFRADPATGAILAEDGFWGEVFALTHWLRGRPPVPRLSIQRVVTLAVGSRGVGLGPELDRTRSAGNAGTGARPIRDMVVGAPALAGGSSDSAPRDESPLHPPGTLAGLSPLGLADEEVALLCALESLGARIQRIPARRNALRQVLEQGDFDLLHLISHGEFGGTAIADASAVLLEDGVFTVAELSPRMTGPLRRCSPLVFFNTCHSGRLGFSLTRLGAWGCALHAGGLRRVCRSSLARDRARGASIRPRLL